MKLFYGAFATLWVLVSLLWINVGNNKTEISVSHNFREVKRIRGVETWMPEDYVQWVARMGHCRRLFIDYEPNPDDLGENARFEANRPEVIAGLDDLYGEIQQYLSEHIYGDLEQYLSEQLAAEFRSLSYKLPRVYAGGHSYERIRVVCTTVGRPAPWSYRDPKGFFGR